LRLHDSHIQSFDYTTMASSSLLLLLSQDESDYLHRSIYEYFQWYFKDTTITTIKNTEEPSSASRRQRPRMMESGISNNTKDSNENGDGDDDDDDDEKKVGAVVLESERNEQSDLQEEESSQEDQHEHNPLPRKSIQEDDDPSSHGLLLALEQLFPACHHGASTLDDDSTPISSSSSSSRPVLISALLAYRSTSQHSRKQQGQASPIQTPMNATVVNSPSIKKKNQPPPSPHPYPSSFFIWDDYYQALQKLLEDGKLPPDSTQPRGFLSWCVHQRWVYKHYHHHQQQHHDDNSGNATDKSPSNAKSPTAAGETIHARGRRRRQRGVKKSNDDDDDDDGGGGSETETGCSYDENNNSDSDNDDKVNPLLVGKEMTMNVDLQCAAALSHLTPERIAHLDELGFQWEVVVHDEEENAKNHHPVEDIANRIVVSRGEITLIPTTQQRKQWHATFEKYKPILLEDNKAKKTDETGESGEKEDLLENNDSNAKDRSEVNGTKITRAFRNKAKRWLETQMLRYREWDAGFVDFPKDQRDALGNIGLLPKLVVNQEQSPLMEAEAVHIGEEQNKSPPRHHLMLGTLPSPLSAKQDNHDETVSSPSMPRPNGISFEERYASLLHFQSAYGHVHVTNLLDPTLARWVKKERMKYRKAPDSYPANKKQMLGKLGFCWYPQHELNYEKRGALAGTGNANHDLLWFKRLEDLKVFQKKFGHTNVPKSYDDKELATWVRHTKARYREFNAGTKKFPKHRLEALAEIGFDVKPIVNKTASSQEGNEERTKDSAPTPTPSKRQRQGSAPASETLGEDDDAPSNSKISRKRKAASPTTTSNNTKSKKVSRTSSRTQNAAVTISGNPPDTLETQDHASPTGGPAKNNSMMEAATQPNEFALTLIALSQTGPPRKAAPTPAKLDEVEEEESTATSLSGGAAALVLVSETPQEVVVDGGGNIARKPPKLGNTDLAIASRKETHSPTKKKDRAKKAKKQQTSSKRRKA
jgi:hypothetical protein